MRAMWRTWFNFHAEPRPCSADCIAQRDARTVEAHQLKAHPSPAGSGFSLDWGSRGDQDCTSLPVFNPRERDARTHASFTESHGVRVGFPRHSTAKTVSARLTRKKEDGGERQVASCDLSSIQGEHHPIMATLALALWRA